MLCRILLLYHEGVYFQRELRCNVLLTMRCSSFAVGSERRPFSGDVVSKIVRRVGDSHLHLLFPSTDRHPEFFTSNTLPNSGRHSVCLSPWTLIGILAWSSTVSDLISPWPRPLQAAPLWQSQKTSGSYSRTEENTTSGIPK